MQISPAASAPTLDPAFDRRSGIGASEVASILGLDARRTPLALWLDKTGQRPPFAGNEWTRMGHRLESVIADSYAERRGVTLTPCTTRRHATHQHVFATPDRAVEGESTLVECKSVFSPRVMTQFGEDGSSDYPHAYAVQCMVQAAVYDVEVVHLAALIGAELRVYRVPRDLDRERRLLDAVEAWWDRYIVGGERPAMDGSDAAAEYLARLFPKHERDMLRAETEGAIALVRDVVTLHAERKAAEEAFEVAKQNLQMVIGDAAGIECPGLGRVTWKKANGSLKTEWESVAREAGADDALIAKHTRSVGGSRRFLVTAEKSQ